MAPPTKSAARRRLLVGILTPAALLLLGFGFYRWATSDLEPPARVILRPEIESTEPGATLPSERVPASTVDPGRPPWETVGVSRNVAHLVERHEPLWRSAAQLMYVTVEDRQAVRQVMGDRWERARFISLRGLSTVGPDTAARRAIGGVTEQAINFFSHSVNSFDEIGDAYLTGREFRTEAMPQWLLDSYVFVFDSRLPFETNDDSSKRKVMEDFFNVRRKREHSGFLLTRVASAEEGFVGAFYWLGSPNDSRHRLFDVLKREGKAEYWAGGVSSSAFFITQGRPSLDERLRQGQVLWGEAYFIVQTANNDRLPMRVGAYYDSVNNVWHLAEVNFQSSPVFGGPTIVQ